MAAIDPALLDNPVWYALVGLQAKFAMGSKHAKGFLPEVAPFFAIAEASKAAYRDLNAILGRAREARLIRAAQEPAPAGWTKSFEKAIVQMVCSRPARLYPHAGVDKLDRGDIADMMALAESTKPGPFGSRTAELGDYVGIRVNGRLVAMAGERFKLPGITEISAICTLPAYRGRGYGAAMVGHLINAVFARGELPILHVFPENPAMKLYEAMGFVERARLNVVWLVPSDRLRRRRPRP